MHESQAKGYYLEEIVRQLMRGSRFINVQTGNIPGRGADHQIDSYGTFLFCLPFVYPIRLISEVKWFKKKYAVRLPRIRDFLGVMIDVAQNYFAPRDASGESRNLARERYTDCGAYFSATGFSPPAQDYAWAHGIYLISFSQDPMLMPILDRAEELIKEDFNVWDRRSAKKAHIIEMAHIHFQNDVQLRELMNRKKAYVGILDELYPVMMIMEGEFMFSPTQPDELSEEDLPLESRAIKERRLEGEVDVNFQFRFQDTQFSFSLPLITSKNIIRAIETTYGGQAFAFLDIPLVLEANQMRYRRIFRIRLMLPEDFKASLK